MSFYLNEMRALTRKKITLDSATSINKPTSSMDSSDDYTRRDIALKAVAGIHAWAETTDSNLDQGETLADRLKSLMIGIADINKDGEITSDEQDILDIALNAIYEYLVSIGCTEEDAGSLVNDWDEESGDRVFDIVSSNLPNGEDAENSIDDFVFCADDGTFDSAYKNKIAFKNGAKTKVKMRISGPVRLTGKQKSAIRKMLMKSHSALAQRKRLKTMKVRRKAGF